MLSNIRPAIVMIVFFTLLTGLAYPLAVTGVAQALFRGQANGELVRDRSGQVTGSQLIGQAFIKPEYLHPRPSAAGAGYDASSSGGSNMGPLSQKLADRMAGDAAAIQKSAPNAVIPADAVTTSGSGLDPDISPEYAHLQVARIAAARHAQASAVDALFFAKTTPALLGFIGQPHVNVFELNRALDARFPVGHPAGR
jgi:K+-transporting ATPase ATPase C chain